METRSISRGNGFSELVGPIVTFAESPEMMSLVPSPSILTVGEIWRASLPIGTCVRRIA